jgi:hypothetical protein
VRENVGIVGHADAQRVALLGLRYRSKRAQRGDTCEQRQETHWITSVQPSVRLTQIAPPSARNGARGQLITDDTLI